MQTNTELYLNPNEYMPGIILGSDLSDREKVDIILSSYDVLDKIRQELILLSDNLYKAFIISTTVQNTDKSYKIVFNDFSKSYNLSEFANSIEMIDKIVHMVVTNANDKLRSACKSFRISHSNNVTIGSYNDIKDRSSRKLRDTIAYYSEFTKSAISIANSVCSDSDCMYKIEHAKEEDRKSILVYVSSHINCDCDYSTIVSSIFNDELRHLVCMSKLFVK